MRLKPLTVTLALGSSVLAAPPTTKPTSSPPTPPTVTIPGLGTVIGSVDNNAVEYYRGIPYAQPPTGTLRLKPPLRLQKFPGNPPVVSATGFGPACPQATSTVEFTPLLLEVLSSPDPSIAESLLYGTALGDETEDCLTISVMRPAGTKPGAKLPVLFWIYGGAFEAGSAQAYNGSVLIPQSVARGKPLILVGVNYRLGAFGFLPGKQVLEEGVSNLGLLDQRMGLQWVSDHIASFGGDPNKVTIWGQSAGAMSVFDQMALFNGDHKYKGKKLFRGTILSSGSLLPTEPVDGPRAQQVFDTVAEKAGCSGAPDKLKCLRETDYETFLAASSSLPAFLSYNSLAFSYAPRPDGRVLSASPEVLAGRGRYAKVPILIGNQENEGTVFSLFQSNLTTEADLVSYLGDIFFQNATQEQVAGLVDTYPPNPDSPTGVGPTDSPNIYPEYKRLAAILGDYSFHFMSRLLLETLPSKGDAPAWAYEATWGRGTPILGTFHGTDLAKVLYVKGDKVSTALRDLYISFVSDLDPNKHASGGKCSSKSYFKGIKKWPTWQEGKKLLTLGAESAGLIKDDARAKSFEYVRKHLGSLRL